MKKDKHKTKVMFRVIKEDGELIAFFPEIDNYPTQPSTRESYMHIGQHGAAGIDFIKDSTEPVYPVLGGKFNPVYGDLYVELEGIGYDLEIDESLFPGEVAMIERKDKMKNILSMVDLVSPENAERFSDDLYIAKACVEGELPGLSVKPGKNISSPVIFEIENTLIWKVADTSTGNFVYRVADNIDGVMQNHREDKPSLMDAIKEVASKKEPDGYIEGATYKVIDSFNIEEYKNDLVATSLKSNKP